MPSYSIEELRRNGPEPLMRWLLARGPATPLTYGYVAQRLERELHIPKIFPTHIGGVAGTLMEQILHVDKDAPLLNVLVVDQLDHLPGKGVTDFLVDRFGAKYSNYENFSLADKERIVRRAVLEVRSYKKWADIYSQLFNRPSPRIDQEISQLTEQDGKSPDGRKGGGGEGPLHKRLKKYIANNPKLVDSRIGKHRTIIPEAPLPSGDYVDLRIENGLFTVLIEVKSRISGLDDLRRGIFQCIKYDAVARAEFHPLMPDLRVYLVTENHLPKYLLNLARSLNIRTCVVSVPDSFK